MAYNLTVVGGDAGTLHQNWVNIPTKSYMTMEECKARAEGHVEVWEIFGFKRTPAGIWVKGSEWRLVFVMDGKGGEWRPLGGLK